MGGKKCGFIVKSINEKEARKKEIKSKKYKFVFMIKFLICYIIFIKFFNDE